MNVPKNASVKKNTYDKLAGFCGFGILITGWCNNNKTYSDTNYAVWYYSKS